MSEQKRSYFFDRMNKRSFESFESFVCLDLWRQWQRSPVFCSSYVSPTWRTLSLIHIESSADDQSLGKARAKPRKELLVISNAGISCLILSAFPVLKSYTFCV